MQSTKNFERVLDLLCRKYDVNVKFQYNTFRYPAKKLLSRVTHLVNIQTSKATLRSHKLVGVFRR